MEFDFDANRVSDYVTVPTGTYVCRITDVRCGMTRAGDERWSLRLVVAEGQHIGKQAAWDNLVFSARGRARARKVLQALGLPSEGKVQIEPADLEGRTAIVDVRPAEYQSPSGQVVRRNEVPYDGFRPLSPADAEGLLATSGSQGSSPGSSQGNSTGTSLGGPPGERTAATLSPPRRSTKMREPSPVNPDDVPF